MASSNRRVDMDLFDYEMVGGAVWSRESNRFYIMWRVTHSEGHESLFEQKTTVIESLFLDTAWRLLSLRKLKYIPHL
jgi:hypothetical protein